MIQRKIQILFSKKVLGIFFFHLYQLVRVLLCELHHLRGELTHRAVELVRRVHQEDAPEKTEGSVWFLAAAKPTAQGMEGVVLVGTIFILLSF